MPTSSRIAPALLVTWGVAAIAVVVGGVLPRLPFPPPLLVPILVAVVALAVVLVPGVAAWIHDLDLRTLVAFHLVRFIGGYFLWLASVGRLAPNFATTAGIGDLIVAVGALGLLLSGYVRPGPPLMIWNIVGTLDILVVVANALRSFLSAPDGVMGFYHLPLGLLPTFIVPLIIVSHVVIFLRLRTTPG